MSVLLNITMPKTCEVCPCNDDNWRCGATKEYFDYDDMCERRRADCPLIEVPPHGDLVDRGGLMDIYADRLTAVAERYSPDSSECGILSGAMKLLAIQPTVIEAEAAE